MPTHYESEKVKCPFYREEHELSVICEGVVSKVCTHSFKGPSKKQRIKEKYCNAQYSQCPYYKAVLSLYK